jgi:GTP diphosphokinase / guanosine-3',5'-bis(diphosphate) 3'-diphosphatase
MSINHLIEVAALVAAAGAAEDVICAALLHDAIEDQKVSATEIAGLFGTAVAAMVLEVTDNRMDARRTPIRTDRPRASPEPQR